MTLLKKWNSFSRQLTPTFRRKEKGECGDITAETGLSSELASLPVLPPNTSRESKEDRQKIYRKPVPQHSSSTSRNQAKGTAQKVERSLMLREHRGRRKTEAKTDPGLDLGRPSVVTTEINIGIPLISLGEAQRRQREANLAFHLPTTSSRRGRSNTDIITALPPIPTPSTKQHGLRTHVGGFSNQSLLIRCASSSSEQKQGHPPPSVINIHSRGQPKRALNLAKTRLNTPKEHPKPETEMKDSLFATEKRTRSQQTMVSPISFKLGSTEVPIQNGSSIRPLSSEDHVYSFGTGIFDHRNRDSGVSKLGGFLASDTPKIILPLDHSAREGDRSELAFTREFIPKSSKSWWNMPKTTSSLVRTPKRRTRLSNSADHFFAVARFEEGGHVDPRIKSWLEKRQRRRLQQQVTSVTMNDMMPQPLQLRRSNTISTAVNQSYPFNEELWPDMWVPSSPTVEPYDNHELTEEYDEEYHDQILEEAIQELKILQLRIPNPEDMGDQARRSGWITDPRVGVNFYSSLKRWKTVK